MFPFFKRTIDKTSIADNLPASLEVMFREAYSWGKNDIRRSSELARISDGPEGLLLELGRASQSLRVFHCSRTKGVVAFHDNFLKEPIDPESKRAAECLWVGQTDFDPVKPLCVPIQLNMSSSEGKSGFMFLQLVLYRQEIGYHKNEGLEMYLGNKSTPEIRQKRWLSLYELTTKALAECYEESFVFWSENFENIKPAIDSEEVAKNLFESLFSSHECEEMLLSGGSESGVCVSLHRHIGTGSYISSVFIDKGEEKVPLSVKVIDERQAMVLLEATQSFELKNIETSKEVIQ